MIDKLTKIIKGNPNNTEENIKENSLSDKIINILSGDISIGEEEHKINNKNDLVDFMSVILFDIEEHFQKETIEIFGKKINSPKLIIYNDSTSNNCGAYNYRLPYYCPMDESIYIEVDTLIETIEEFKMKGNSSIVYILYHEWGHHIITEIIKNTENYIDYFSKKTELDLNKKNIIRFMKNYKNQKLTSKTQNIFQTYIELTCDFYAGYAAKNLYNKGLFHKNDLNDLFYNSGRFGDDIVQKMYGSNSKNNHGNGKQRMQAFKDGFNSIDITLSPLNTIFFKKISQ